MKRLMKKAELNIEETVTKIFSEVEYDVTELDHNFEGWKAEPDVGIMSGGAYENSEFVTTYKRDDIEKVTGELSEEDWNKVCDYIVAEYDGKYDKFTKKFDTGVDEIDFDHLDEDESDDCSIKISYTDTELKLECTVEYIAD